MSSRSRVTSAAVAPVWFTIYANDLTSLHPQDVTDAVDAGVRPTYTSAFCYRASVSEAATLLDELAFPSKTLALCIWKWHSGLSRSLWEGREFVNLVDLDLSGQIQGDLLVTLMLRMPALKHLTLAMDDICCGETQAVEDFYPPFTLETLTCRGTCWFDDGWWLWWTTSTALLWGLRSFAFECNDSHAFSACFKDHHLAQHLTTVLLFLYYEHSGGSWSSRARFIEDTLRDNVATLKRCTSLRILQVKVDWRANDVPENLERIFAALPHRLRGIELYATHDSTAADMAATDSFLAAQLTSAPGLSALADLTVSCPTEFSPSQTFPALLRACRLRRVRFRHPVTPRHH